MLTKALKGKRTETSEGSRIEGGFLSLRLGFVFPFCFGVLKGERGHSELFLVWTATQF